MIDSVLNLLFRCSHRRLTRPVTPVSKAGVAQGQTYVVCLDCGKQFSYDLEQMRIGKPLESSHEEGVLHPGMPKPRGQKVKYALWASVPLAVLIGAVLKTKRPQDQSGKPPEPR
jgi:DNA-directed RNA polymerase subunit RPC12/RpoP